MSKKISLSPFDGLLGSQLKTKGPVVLNEVVGHNGRAEPYRFMGDDLFTLSSVSTKRTPEGGQVIVFTLTPDKSPKPFKFANLTAAGLVNYFEVGSKTNPEFFELFNAACELALRGEPDIPAARPQGWGAWA